MILINNNNQNQEIAMFKNESNSLKGEYSYNPKYHTKPLNLNDIGEFTTDFSNFFVGTAFGNYEWLEADRHESRIEYYRQCGVKIPDKWGILRPYNGSYKQWIYPIFGRYKGEFCMRNYCGENTYILTEADLHLAKLNRQKELLEKEENAKKIHDENNKKDLCVEKEISTSDFKKEVELIQNNIIPIEEINPPKIKKKKKHKSNKHNKLQINTKFPTLK